MGFYENLRPWSKSPPCIYDYVLPLMGNTSYIYSIAVYVRCVDDLNEQGDIVCLSHRLN